MPGQREMTQSSEKLEWRRMKALAEGRKQHIPNIGKNCGRVKHPAAQPASLHTPAFLGMINGHDRFLPRDIGRSNADPAVLVGSRAMVIPSHEYWLYLQDPKAYRAKHAKF
jgi:hypothetical protein